MKYILTIFVGGIIMLACSQKRQSSVKQVEDHAAIYNAISSVVGSSALEKAQKCLVIPIDVGCEACIKASINFVHKNRNPKNIFIITSQSSQILKQRLKGLNFDLSSFNSSYVVFDTLNKCFKERISDVTPVIYTINHKDVKNKVFLYAATIDEDLKKIQ